ncbi:mitochondrial uncoupling protein 5-like [Mercurialis annua]|uniref:mitochondrial uncoupling protein 5-like n=1 Tax=Mercurialis annua TaxID=3986 RepID=UPI00215F23A9|nr:mitochondrial uncoupling protein 5-like [Mercurialis annua]
MGLKCFLEGGIASIVAGATTHPLDLIKVRMQLSGEFELHLPSQPAAQVCCQCASALNISLPVVQVKIQEPHPGPISTGIRIIQSEGVAALFSGVSATILRQTLYSTTRMGLYAILKQKWLNPKTGNLPLTHKILAGLIAGGVGAAVGNPADVAMVRMQADGRLPITQRRNYKSVIHAITQISKQEGFTSLWRGSGLTVNRAMIVTASQLASYDQIKEMILEKGVMGDGIRTHVAASLAAGFVAAVASNPVDVIKTRIMNMTVVAGAEPPYKGGLDCAVKTVRGEGLMALYKGFVPTISRQGPFTVVLFVTLEQVRKLLKDF